MITGAHFLLYSQNAEADRAFFRDVLGFASVNAGEGWLIFALPPAEAGIHPAETDSAALRGGQMLNAALYLLCDDLQSSMASLKQKNVQCSEVHTADWGIVTMVPLPSGGRIGLYQPKHPTALHLAK